MAFPYLNDKPLYPPSVYKYVLLALFAAIEAEICTSLQNLGCA